MRNNATKPAKGEKDIVLESQSTRQMILAKSLELINGGGMVDFRIDALATSLDLSPGNITYHFSRKEDICVALWDEHLDEYADIQRTVTSLLDLKQVYLIDRVVMQLNYKYRGVLIFRSADLGAMTRDHKNAKVNIQMHMSFVKRVMTLLETNGYIHKDEINGFPFSEIVRKYHYLIMRWGINFAYMAYPLNKVETQLDHLALLCLHVMYPLYTEKGLKEFHEIAGIVESGNLLP